MAKLLTDASYKPRDKSKEAAEFKDGKRANAGFIDLTPKELSKKTTATKGA